MRENESFFHLPHPLCLFHLTTLTLPIMGLKTF
uniref:Uncharacterized protein n=1 Tax=Arundo donax TaxID=35708 RepID=A0A0A9AD55_ARUDO